MILLTMTYKEMYDNLAADYKKIKIKQDYLLPKAVKAFRKVTRFPAWQLFEYKIPATNNSYIIYFYAESRYCIEKPKVDFFCILFNENQRFVIKWDARPYQHTTDSKPIMLRQIHAYTSHFLSRYNERFLKNKNLTSNEVACRYFSRNYVNKNPVPIKITENISRRCEEYGELCKQGFRVEDGFCLMQAIVQGEFYEDKKKDEVDAMFLLYKTFLSASELSDEQKNAIDKECMESWIRGMEFYEQNSSLTLQLSL